GSRWMRRGGVKEVGEWLGEAGEDRLADWDISRDAPYFGFEIPGAPGKYFYVWLDAPIGYFASFKAYADKNGGIDFASFVEDEPSQRAGTEQFPFLGKDILYFHALFLPAVLKFLGHPTPPPLSIHGFPTRHREKNSETPGTF